MNAGPPGLYTKKYGQVLLKNRKVAEFEVAALGLPEGSTVLEIGPGPGTLTALLLERGYIVTAVEPDHRFVEELGARFSHFIENGKLILVKQDFLETEAGSYDAIIGNVPYQISSAIIFRLGMYSFSRAVLMFQREFCHRLVAQPGTKDYSRLSVNAQLRFRIRIIANISRRSFQPVPDVDSSVVELIPRQEFPEHEISAADEIFRKLFAGRRKKISTVLKGIVDENKEKRVEELSPEELLGLARRHLSLSSR